MRVHARPFTSLLAAALLPAALLAGPAAMPAAAQAGAGTATGAVLQMPAGSRAAGLGGAFTAGDGGDVLFYNPAGAARHAAAAAASYQRHVMDVGFSSVGGAVRLRWLAIGATFSVLDYGSIDETVPDPAFGGQRGIETGEVLSANDAVARAMIAVPLLRDRLALGAAFGLYWSTLAESVRTVEIFDLGAQLRIRPDLVVGTAFRHGGGQLEGASLGSADLPAELRAGVAWTRHRPFALGASAALHADLIMPRYEAPTTAAVGVEIASAADAPLGVLAGQPVGAALRLGFNGAPGSDAVGRFHAGAGITVDGVAVDYTLQPMGDLGMAHRFGIRWTPR